MIVPNYTDLESDLDQEYQEQGKVNPKYILALLQNNETATADVMLQQYELELGGILDNMGNYLGVLIDLQYNNLKYHEVGPSQEATLRNIASNTGETGYVLAQNLLSLAFGDEYLDYTDPLPSIYQQRKSQEESNDEVKSETEILYPNPSTGIFNLISESEIVSLIITDMQGREIDRFENISPQTYQIDLSNQQDGIYIATVNKVNDVAYFKLIVRKK